MLVAGAAAAEDSSAPLTLQQDDSRGQLKATRGPNELFTYNYGAEWELPHFFPLNTPSGKNLLVQKTDPYPHHRAFWFSDTVVRDGVRGDVYNGYYSGVKIGKKQHQAPFNTGSRHASFEMTTSTGNIVGYREHLVWETQRTTTAFPLLDEHRDVAIQILPGGGYFMDLTFRVTATYGDVEFVSDAVHYSWPYVRMNPEFSVDKGGTLITDSGTTGQEGTNLKPARWIDYTNTVDGQTEGIAMYQYPIPGNEQPLWLTRNYGTFGPRRPDHQSGKRFTLAKGESLTQRVGVYVHSGDSRVADVAGIYKRYTNGSISE